MKSSATERFRPFNRSKKAAGPRRAPSGRDVDSTLITSARSPARRSPQSGPAHSAERSTTRRPERSRRGAGPSGTGTTPGRFPASPTRATGRPSQAARADELVGLSGGHGTLDGGPHGGGTRRRVGRVRATPAPGPCPRGAAATPATNPDRARNSRQLPPQLVAPRRHSPMSAARSPRRASGWRPAKGRATPRPRPPGARAGPGAVRPSR